MRFAAAEVSKEAKLFQTTPYGMLGGHHANQLSIADVPDTPGLCLFCFPTPDSGSAPRPLSSSVMTGPVTRVAIISGLKQKTSVSLGSMHFAL